MRRVVRFWLGDEPRDVAGAAPTTTLLDWLRGVEGRTGTKEGCNEGDCGACTVLLTRLRDGRVVHEPVCACIRLLATVDGCRVATVEDLAAADGTLHPVQRAMVEQHASQCGFCTPGIVTSLWALRLDHPEPPDEAEIEARLAGNLCRCTGYGPIVRAARAMYALEPAPAVDPLLAAAELWHTRLAERDTAEPLLLDGPDGTRLVAPVRLEELSDLLAARPDALLLAGGTDVGLRITKDLDRPPLIVWLGRVAELHRLEETAEGLRIGAAVTWREAASALRRLAPGLGELVDRFAGEQIRATATVVGNLANASPVGDGAPAFLALDARLELRRGDRRRELPLAEFFRAYRRTALEPGEFVEAVFLPRPSAGTRLLFEKVSKRREQDIATVSAGIALAIEDGRVRHVRLAFGGMAAIPARARAAEAALEGAAWDEAALERAVAALDRDFEPISDHRGSAAYRRTVAANLLWRAWLESRGVPVRLHAAEPALG
ncbi:MAG: xanthine dehydrogenase small subunit [Geminicoccaceae bacterium]|nr:xanthine dehydrogenase small subunit [Geminicoccaceae bacterium]